MKKLEALKKISVCMLLTCLLVVSSVLSGYKTVSATSTKHIIIWEFNKNNLEYYKAYSAVEYLGDDIQWDNIIGGGKKKKIKISSKAKYYLIDYTTTSMKTYQVSKSKFKKALYETNVYEENGKKWYAGLSCKITIKKGKVVKFVQTYQA